MSTQVFPSLLGLGWPLQRTEIWSTRKQTAISGKRTRIADWSFPRHQWTLSMEFLRQGLFQGTNYIEMAELCGFFNLRSGGMDTFLYQDGDFNSVTGQTIAVGDGVTSAFPVIAAFGGYVEPIYAPNTSAPFQFYLNGAPTSVAAFNGWGTATPGLVGFASAPGAGVVVSADYSFYFPCSFDIDQMDFSKFMAALYEVKKITFSSEK